MFNILNKIKNTNSRNEKLHLLIEWIKEDRRNEQFLKLAYTDNAIGIDTKTITNALGYTTMGEKDVGESYIKGKKFGLFQYMDPTDNKPTDDTPMTYDLDWFFSFYNECAELSGTRLANKLKELHNVDNDSVVFYIKCLIKNLNIGINIKTINTALEKTGHQKISDIGLTLAGSIDYINREKEITNIIRMHGKVYVERKYDGVRCVAIRKESGWTYISRNGKPLLNVNDLDDHLSNVFPIGSCVDGELIDEDGFNALMKNVHRTNKSTTTTKKQKFYIFDILIFNNINIENKKMSERKNILNQFTFNDHIILSQHHEFSDTQDILNFFDTSIKNGLEGIMIKTINGTYSRDRKPWWKLKPITTAEFEIVQLITAQTGKYSGKKASIEVRDKTNTIKVNVGGGLSEDDIEFLNSMNESEFVGKIIEVAFDSITPINTQGQRSLRFPRFKAFRFDKDEADAL